MGHSVAVPDWLVLAIGLMLTVIILAMMRRRIRRLQRHSERAIRRQRHVAHRRSWDWIMGRSRQRRLTHDASDAEGAAAEAQSGGVAYA